MWHPLQLVPAGASRWVVLAALAALTFWVGLGTDQTPSSPAVPWGIVDLELAGSRTEAERVFDAWEEALRTTGGTEVWRAGGGGARAAAPTSEAEPAGGAADRSAEVAALLQASLRRDNLFLLAYSTALALACLMAAGALPYRGWAAAGGLLAWLQWLAALLDRVENRALAGMADGIVTDVGALLARWCALAKFALVGLGLLYAAAGALAAGIALARRRRRKPLPA